MTDASPLTKNQTRTTLNSQPLSPPRHTATPIRTVAADREALAALDRLAALPAADLAPLARLAGSTTARGIHAILLSRLELPGVTVAEIVGPSRYQTIVRARHALAWYWREHLGRSFPEIGRALRRDHSTIQYAVRNFRRAITDEKLWALAYKTRLELPDTVARGERTTISRGDHG